MIETSQKYKTPSKKRLTKLKMDSNSNLNTIAASHPKSNKNSKNKLGPKTKG